MKSLLSKIGKGAVYLSLMGFSILNPRVNKKEIFLTGFGDSPRFKDNPTKELMHYFSNRGFNTKVLNVNYDDVSRDLDSIYNNFKPKKIISMGVSEIVYSFSLSVKARNIMSDSIADNSGKVYLSKIIDSGFPKEICLEEENLYKVISKLESENVMFLVDTSGSSYVCNRLLFKGIDLSTEKGVEFYFIHVPEDILTNKDKLKNLKKAINIICEN
jgi:pyrrolidone-carboxylate peptidase